MEIRHLQLDLEFYKEKATNVGKKALYAENLDTKNQVRDMGHRIRYLENQLMHKEVIQFFFFCGYFAFALISGIQILKFNDVVPALYECFGSQSRLVIKIFLQDEDAKYDECVEL